MNSQDFKELFKEAKDKYIGQRLKGIQEELVAFGERSYKDHFELYQMHLKLSREGKTRKIRRESKKVLKLLIQAMEKNMNQTQYLRDSINNVDSQNTNVQDKVDEWVAKRTKDTKVSKLEILSQMSKNAFGEINNKNNFKNIKEFGIGCLGGQLVSTFNIPGYRFAKKYLGFDNEDLTFEEENKFRYAGFFAGFALDGIPYATVLAYMFLWENSSDAPAVAPILLGIAGVKVATNILSLAGSGIYELASLASNAYKSSRESLEESATK